MSESGIEEVPAEAIKVVEIIPTGEGAWFLLRYDEAGVCRADTWHRSVEEAKESARVEYGIADGDWVE